LLILQTFDPPGIGARNLQESLWLQLRTHSYSLAEIIVRDHFNDLLQGRFAAIQKHLHISNGELQKALQRISRLRLRPASKFDDAAASFIVPDLSIREVDSVWMLQIGSEELPSVQIRGEYVDLIKQPIHKEEKSQLRHWVTSGKWLQRCIRRRQETLRIIGHLLIRTQRKFLSETGQIAAMDIQELARILNVHVSTAWRAVARKTLFCSSGLIPLKLFFSSSPKREPIKELIRRAIQSEDNDAPMSDEAIKERLQEKGVRCARRTVAKYRRSLQIGSSTRRKILLNKQHGSTASAARP
jgi:RNA polymerase sigma-54 factor